MSKYSLSAASLVAAVPAAFLAYLLVMAFMQKPGFDKMAGFFQIISGLTLALVTLVVLMPVGILIFGKKPEKAEKKDKPEQAAEEQAEETAEAEEPDEDLAVDEDEDFADDDFEDFDEEDDEFK